MVNVIHVMSSSKEEAQHTSGVATKRARPVSKPQNFSFVYEAVAIQADCDVSACVSIENADEEVTEIGSGVNISPLGLILTACHVAPELECLRIVAFADGVPMCGKCIAVSEKWDLALLQILVPAKPKPKGKKTNGSKTKRSRLEKGPAQLPVVAIRKSSPRRGEKLVCVGQPGRPRGARLECVTGSVVSVAKDPLCVQDNDSSVGGLVHSCPVFAGNSALLRASTGELIGVHTGYSHKRYSYHGTTLEAIKAFLSTHTHLPTTNVAMSVDIANHSEQIK